MEIKEILKFWRNNLFKESKENSYEKSIEGRGSDKTLYGCIGPAILLLGLGAIIYCGLDLIINGSPCSSKHKDSKIEQKVKSIEIDTIKNLDYNSPLTIKDNTYL